MKHGVKIGYVDFSSLPFGCTASGVVVGGWFDSPDPKGESLPLAADDGDADSEQLNDARYIEFVALVHSPSHDAQHKLGDRLSVMVPNSGARLEVGEGDGTVRRANVLRASGVRFTPIPDRLADVSVTLKAPDPRKYGVTRRFPATGTTAARTATNVSHEGNYPAAPKITVTGYMPGGFTAFGTGSDRFRVTEGVNTGEVLVADFRTGHVYLDGVQSPAAGGYRSLARIPPGATRNTNVVPATETGYGQYFVEVTDTWI